MSTFACAEVRDLAPELAVNIVGGPERAEALDHMSECGPCRAYVAELAEAADALTLLAPEAEPPPGFERRVIAAIGAGRRRSWRRLAMVAASVAAATAIVSIVGVRLVEGTDSRPVVAPAESTSVENLAMTTDDGIDVGEVHISDGHPSVVVVTVDYLISDGNVRRRGLLAQARRRGDRSDRRRGRPGLVGRHDPPPTRGEDLAGRRRRRHALLGDAPDCLRRQQLLPEELQHPVEGDRAWDARARP